jgi:hypothetical protein
MPRRIPRFDNQLASVAQTATAIAKAGEISALCSDRNARQQWTRTRLESLYELAFLRVFASWEMCLEGILYRTLCGYSRTTGIDALHSGPYHSTLVSAESAVLSAFGGSRGASYLLWHDPNKVIKRCQRFVSSGTQETVLTSNVARLEYISRTRHRIVHDSLDAKNKFDSATRGLVGTVYPRSRPGKFLRDLDVTSSRPKRWLETIANELVGLLKQMV